MLLHKTTTNFETGLFFPLKLICLTIWTILFDGFQLDLCYGENMMAKTITRNYFSCKPSLIDFENFTVSTCANLRVGRNQIKTHHHINKSGRRFSIKPLPRRKYDDKINHTKLFSAQTFFDRFREFHVATCANLHVSRNQTKTHHHIDNSGRRFPIRPLLRRKFGAKINDAKISFT